jgi:hypothetical protein
VVRPFSRIAAVIATTLTVLAPVLLAPSAAHASGTFTADGSGSVTLNRADAAAGWLARQMTDGQHFEVVFDGVAFPDQGLTIDAIFAFAATRRGDDYAARATAWLAGPDILTGYIGDGAGEAYSGATAKLALAVQVRGADPTAFGGVDLIARLRGLQAPSGRFTDRSAFGDFSNVFGQSFAILALQRTPAGVPATALSFLVASACDDGGFPVFFDAPTCVSDVDATAMAVQALRAAGRSRAAAPAVRWLVDAQTAGGGFSNGAGTANANSTGLAGQALLASGRLVAATRAVLFLRSLQAGCSAPAADRGAIAFTAGGLDPTTDVRATAQGILGLAGVGFAQLSAAGSTGAAPTLFCP